MRSKRMTKKSRSDVATRARVRGGWDEEFNFDFRALEELGERCPMRLEIDDGLACPWRPSRKGLRALPARGAFFEERFQGLQPFLLGFVVAHAASSMRPTRRPSGVSRWSALSMRSAGETRRAR